MQFTELPQFVSSMHTRLWEHLEALRTAGVDLTASLGVRLSYTPTWSQSDGQTLQINNGSLTGRYMRLGKLVLGGGILTRGSNTNQGSSAYILGLPSPAAAYNLVWGAGQAKSHAVGVIGVGTAAIGLVGNGVRVSHTWPGSWATGEIISWQFMYFEA